MAVTQLKDGRWICYYRVSDPDTGKSSIKREYFGRGTRAEQAAWRRNAELNLKTRRPPQRHQGKTFGDLAVAYARAKNLSTNSLYHLKLRLTANILPFFKHRNAIMLTDFDLDRYVSKRRRRVTDSTIRRELTDIQAILNWAVSHRPPLIMRNPVRGYRAPSEDNAIIPPPTDEETRAIIKHASPHLARAVLLAYYLGLRPGTVELLSLTWRQVNFENMTMLVLSAHKGGPEKRMVPIHKNLVPLLKKWHKADNGAGPIIHYQGRPVKKIRSAWKGALKRAGITRRSLTHDHRQHSITTALEAGGDIKALAEIVGSRPETLMKHYQHVTGELHRKTIAKIPAIALMKTNAN